MKKIYYLLVLTLIPALGFTQTSTGLKCYGWAAELAVLDESAVIEMAGFDQEKVNAEDLENDKHKDQPWRFGYKYDTNISLTNSGDWTTVENGSVWRTVISCPGAMTVNLLLEDFNLPEGATLFLYDAARTNKIGAYTSANNRVENELGTELIHGDRIVVEYFEPAAVAGEGSFTISNVIHGYRSLDRIQKDLEKGLNDSGACNVDVNCPLGDDWNNQIRSVAMIVVSGNGICSGALINNTCNDGRLLFLTANHCLGGSTASWAFRFNWESPEGTESCATFSGSTDPGSPYDQTANGATILGNSGGSDYALLEIDNMTSEQAVDWNVFFAGWDRSDAETVTEATGIHHPSGDLKKICREDESPYHDFTGGAQVWWIDDWDQGVTEPGSSGSPLFDQNGRIIGQLYGGAAACSGTDDNDAFDYYGRLGTSWDLGASEYLAPSGCPFSVTDDGLDGGVTCEGVVTAVANDALCFGGTDGSINVTVSGGVSPITYDIGDGPVGSGVFTDLAPGTYTVTVIDGDDCVTTKTVTIDSPANLDAFYSSSPESLGSDGSVNLTVVGGTSGFTYSWTGPGGFTATTEDISGLVFGTYECTITDANGCVHTETNVIVNSAMSVTEDVVGISIYPNPSQGQFVIYNEGNELLSIKVFDLSGRVIVSNALINNTTNTIDLSDKAVGTYVVEIETTNGNYIQRIIKN